MPFLVMTSHLVKIVKFQLGNGLMNGAQNRTKHILIIWDIFCIHIAILLLYNLYMILVDPSHKHETSGRLSSMDCISGPMTHKQTVDFFEQLWPQVHVDQLNEWIVTTKTMAPKFRSLMVILVWVCG